MRHVIDIERIDPRPHECPRARNQCCHAMNRLAYCYIEPSLVDPMSPDHHHKRTSNVLHPHAAIGKIRRMISAEILFAPRSTTQGVSCQSINVMSAPQKTEALRRQTASSAHWLQV